MRLAFLGCGLATRMHSRTLARVAPDVERVYASRDSARARDYAARYHGSGTADSYEAAIADPAIDTVLVATPPHSHLDWTLAALAAGKHVIVEKPPFLHSTDFDAVEAAERTSGRRVLVAENYFYKPVLRLLRELLADGGIGEVRFVAVNALKEQQVGDWRADASIAGGGALFEGGIHWIDFMANLGPAVRAAHGFRAGAAEPERSTVVVLEYDNDALGTLMYSWEVHSPLKGIRLSRIYGSTGSLVFESNGLFVLRTGRRPRLFLPGVRDIAGYRAMFRDFIGALREGRDAAFTTRHARRDLEIIEAAGQTESAARRPT